VGSSPTGTDAKLSSEDEADVIEQLRELRDGERGNGTNPPDRTSLRETLQQRAVELVSEYSGTDADDASVARLARKLVRTALAPEDSESDQVRVVVGASGLGGQTISLGGQAISLGGQAVGYGAPYAYPAYGAPAPMYYGAPAPAPVYFAVPVPHRCHLFCPCKSHRFP
jgi:hypothetical protein